MFTAWTPNGIKVSIALEELQLPYTVTPISLSERVQKEDWYLKINPNVRIPPIVDHANEDFVVFESGAILVYLARKAGRLLPSDLQCESLVMQWLMFQMGGLGPMMVQANGFFRYAEEKVPYAINRYQREVQCNKQVFRRSSKRLTSRLTKDIDTSRRSAAAVKLPCSTTAMNSRSPPVSNIIAP